MSNTLIWSEVNKQSFISSTIHANNVLAAKCKDCTLTPAWFGAQVQYMILAAQTSTPEESL